MKKVIKVQEEHINVNDLTDNHLIGIQSRSDWKEKAYCVKIDQGCYVAMTIPNKEDLAMFSSIKEYCTYFEDSYDMFVFDDADELKKWLIAK